MPVNEVRENRSRARDRGVVVITVGLGLAASLLLGGCSFFGPGNTATGGGTGGDGQSGQSGGGTEPSPAPMDDGPVDFVGLPTTFPTSEIPIIDGDIPFAVDLGTGWTVMVQIDDIAADFADASQKLKDAGFDVLTETSTADASFGAFENATYQVQLTSTDAGEFGLTATYLVVIKG